MGMLNLSERSAEEIELQELREFKREFLRFFTPDSTPAELHADMTELQDLWIRRVEAAPLCEEHKPTGGARSGCVICAGVKLSAALSRIDYACGEPNEMEVSGYDMHQNEDAVVERVRALAARVKAQS